VAIASPAPLGVNFLMYIYIYIFFFSKQNDFVLKIIRKHNNACVELQSTHICTIGNNYGRVRKKTKN